MRLAWGAKVANDFIEALLQMCERFGWTDERASDIMSCMAFETAETFNPQILNRAGSGAVGLIQFIPSTAQGLGVTTAVLGNMTAVQQLTYVEKYFQPYSQKIKSLSDMYMAILAPVAVGAPDDKMLYSSGAAYRLNAPLDLNRDGQITKAEASTFVMAKRIKGLGPGNWAEVRSIGASKGSGLIASIDKIIGEMQELRRLAEIS